MTPLWDFFDALFTWRFAASLGIFLMLAVYSSWLYHLVLQDRDADRAQLAKAEATNARLRDDVDYLAECLGIDLKYEGEGDEPEVATEELPVVEPATVEADALDTEARKEVVLARHRPSEGSRTVAEILAEAGLEPLPGRRGRR